MHENILCHKFVNMNFFKVGVNIKSPTLGFLHLIIVACGLRWMMGLLDKLLPILSSLIIQSSNQSFVMRDILETLGMKILKDLYTRSLRTWYRDCFGNIFKKMLLARLQGIQKNLFSNNSTGLIALRQKLWNDYIQISNQEELYWYQLSCSNWLKLGDRNTRFFHQSFFNMRRKN